MGQSVLVRAGRAEEPAGGRGAVPGSAVGPGGSGEMWEQLRGAVQALEESNAELKSFTSIVSHDLRAPLLNVKGFSAELSGAVSELKALFSGLAGQLDDPGRQRAAEILEQEIPEALGFIDCSVVRMNRLVNSLLKFSRLGHREVCVERVAVGEVVQSLLMSMKFQMEQRGATACLGELPVVVTDRFMLEQILGNLLDNAVKYLDPSRRGRLEIYGEPGAGGTVIHVRDNGRGIAGVELGRIFEMFRRAGAQDVPGHGMGLAYVKALVRKLDGEIWCRSEPGIGSTFSFILPQEGAGDCGAGI